MRHAAVAAGAFAVVVLTMPLVIVAARRAGIVDAPGFLKPQSAPVPYLGGVSVFAGVSVGVLASRPLVLAPLAAALALGVADDCFDLPWWGRLLGQLALGAGVAVTCPVHLAGFTVAIVVIVTMVLTNGVNFVDGLDMLAAGVVAVAAVAFAVALSGPGRELAVALAASLFGFLLYNRPPARVYLGDGGSYLLGTALAVLLAEALGPGLSQPLGTAALALVAVPVAEVAFAIVRRVRGRRSPASGDRGHPYDRLVARGWPRAAVSLVYVLVTALLAAAAVAATRPASLAPAVLVDVASAALLVAGAAATGALSPGEAPRR